MLSEAGIIFFQSMCLCVLQKLKDYWPEIDVTWQEHVLWWTVKVIKFLVTFHLGVWLKAIFVLNNKKSACNLKTAGQILI